MAQKNFAIASTVTIAAISATIYGCGGTSTAPTAKIGIENPSPGQGGLSHHGNAIGSDNGLHSKYLGIKRPTAIAEKNIKFTLHPNNYSDKVGYMASSPDRKYLAVLGQGKIDVFERTSAGGIQRKAVVQADGRIGCGSWNETSCHSLIVGSNFLYHVSNDFLGTAW